MAFSKCAQHLIETRSDAISTTRFRHTIVTEPPIARRQSCFIWLALVHHQRLHRMELMKKQTISIFVRKKAATRSMVCDVVMTTTDCAQIEYNTFIIILENGKRQPQKRICSVCCAPIVRRDAFAAAPLARSTATQY